MSLILKADDQAKQNKIEEAIEDLNQSIKVKEGSKIISGVSKNLADNLTLLLENQRSYSKILSEAKYLNKSGQFEEANKTLDFLFEMDLTQFLAIKEEANQIKIKNEEAITNAEIAKAKADAEDKEKAALAAKEKAEEEAKKSKRGCCKGKR